MHVVKILFNRNLKIFINIKKIIKQTLDCLVPAQLV